MKSTKAKGRADHLRGFVHDLNHSWLNRRFEELKQYFHKDMVILSPDSGKRLKGRDACVKSYEQFMATSKVHQYKESRFKIDHWGNTAVVVYQFEIGYEWDGKKSRDFGTDVFLLIRERMRWRAIWRTLIAKKSK